MQFACRLKFLVFSTGLAWAVHNSSEVYGRSVCAKATLSLDQTAVIAGNGFRASLRVDDRDIDSVTWEQRLEQLGPTAPVDVLTAFEVSGPTVTTDEQGARFDWAFQPKDDPPWEEKQTVTVGGTLHFLVGGVEQESIELAPVSIIVEPAPRLILHYFLENEVYSDDPFTYTVEPRVPFGFAVLARNLGYGSAKRLTLTNLVPSIEESAKGLAVAFAVVGQNSYSVKDGVASLDGRRPSCWYELVPDPTLWTVSCEAGSWVPASWAPQNTGCPAP